MWKNVEIWDTTITFYIATLALHRKKERKKSTAGIHCQLWIPLSITEEIMDMMLQLQIQGSHFFKTYRLQLSCLLVVTYNMQLITSAWCFAWLAVQCNQVKTLKEAICLSLLRG